MLRIWNVPAVEAPEVRRQVRLLFGVVRPWTVGSLLLGAVLLLPGAAPPRSAAASALLIAGSAVPLLGALALAHRGRVAAAGSLAVVTALFATMASLTLFGGLQGPLGAGLVLAVMAAGVLRGRRAAVAAAVASGAWCAVELGLEAAGWAPVLLPVLYPGGAIATVLACLAIGAALLVLYSREMQLAAAAVQESTVRALESEQQLADLVRASPDGIAVLDAQGVLRSVNEALERMSGFPKEALLGRSLLELPGIGTEETRAQLAMGLERVTTGEFSLTELTLARPDGSPYVVETHARPLRRADGRVELQVVIRDVTSRVEAEGAQRRLEEELRDARRMESLGRLAGGVAHDFRNLLTPVIVNASLLARQPLPGDGADLAREIGEAAERAGELVGHLLSFARRQIRELRVLDLNRVVRDLEPMLRRLIREDVELRLVLAPRLRALRADRSQLEQVLVNLVVNARDAMPSGGRLTLETFEHLVSPAQASHGRGLLSGHYAALAVTDTGEGMSATVREHLFEPFFTTKGAQKGTGLGLATVHGIVSQGGGTIQVESEPGRGTTFRVYLPSVDEAPEEGPPEPPGATAPARDARVLVVDDEDMVRASVARVLRRAGFEVLEARDGTEGLEVARASPAPLDLLLTDVVMPRMAGPELAVALREVHPRARVLFLSGYAEQGVVKGGELQPGVELLVKPFTPEVLLRRVDELLRG